jgi:hypothetical protein
MPLKKLTLRPGVSKENTRYTTENGWYDCDKIRFRQGNPEKIGGWQRISANTFVGICRSLWNWITLGNLNLLGVGTNAKFYIESGGVYNDITPLKEPPVALTNPFDTTSGLPTVTVTDTTHGCVTGDYVSFTTNPVSSTPVTVGGITLSGSYAVTVLTANTYTITAATNATSTVTGGGGSVLASYEIPVGPAFQVPFNGWGAGTWGEGTWGNGGTSNTSIRLWSQSNFGEDLLFCYRGSEIYYWDATNTISTRAIKLSDLAGANETPTICNVVFVSDVSRFVFAFGCNDLFSAVLDPMLIRWSDQENAAEWYPSATNQAGSLKLSHGSEIVGCIQTRQEILVFTDAALYSLQYSGPPVVWGAQILGDNTSIVNQNAMASASGVVYWMGTDKFYVYDGRVQTLPCDLRRYIYNDINRLQYGQIFAGTNEGFNEIWWFYCSENSTSIDRYVVYNYIERVWYYGNLARTAWLDTALRDYPLAATYSNNIVEHEVGLNNNEGNSPQPIHAYISSAEFDIDDGHHFGFVYRILPDITFEGSTADSPTATMTLIPMKNSGSGYNNPTSEGGVDNAAVVRTTTVPIEKFTGQVYIRVRGRQMILKVESTALDTTWQLGSPRIDIRQDGRR